MTIMPTPPWPGNDPDYEYMPDPMGRLGRGTWRRRRRTDPFGRIAIDPDFEWFRNDFDFEKPLGSIFRGRPFDLVAPVGREGGNERFDVAKIETLLAKAGFLDLRPTEGPTGYYGLILEDAIRKFQAAEDLKVDGLINPGGPTLSALARRTTETKSANKTGAESADPADERKPVNLLEAAVRDINRVRREPPGESEGGGLAPGLPALPLLKPLLDEFKPSDSRVSSPPEEADPRREAIADDFVEDIAAPLESHRGNETTKKGNDIVARECRAVLEEDYPDLADRIEHVGGATKDGSGEKTLPEKYVPNRERSDQKLDARRGSNHPDLTWQDMNKGEDDSGAFAHANTATMDKDGRPISREQSSYERLVKNVKEEFANLLPKLRPGADEERYREDVREKCREIFAKWLGPARKNAPDGGDEEASAP